jgi:hypothetical protein
VLVAAVAAAATGCTSPAGYHAETSATPSTHERHAAATPGTTGAVSSSPKELRGQFEQLFGQHALLVTRLMRGVVAKSDDFARAATASLQANTDALTTEVAVAYGTAQEDQFRRWWQRHNDGLVAYATAVAGGNAVARLEARRNLIASCAAQGSWMEVASKGRIEASDGAGMMRDHVEGLMGQVDAFAARDYGRAYLLERDAYEQLYAAGATLAKGSVSPQLAAGLDAPPEKLRSAFSMLLGEHMELVVGAQRATFIGPQEFKAAGAQVNENTAALGRAMGAIVGPDEGAEFQEAWAEHVEGLMDYSSAIAAKDEAARVRAEKDMHTYAVDLAVYFSQLDPKKLDFVSLTREITAHDRHLVDQINAYAARDYAQAQRMETHGYRQMVSVSNLFVDAIQRQVQTSIPVGGTKTGGGGTASRPR